MPLAFAALCEMIARAPTLRRALLIGWGFAVGQFCVGLNWIATAFTFQAAMPAWLGWIAVVLLSFYLAAFMMLAAGLAWKFGRDRRTRAWSSRSPAPGRSANVCAARCSPVSPGTRSGSRWSTRRGGSTSRLIGTYGLSLLVVLGGGALWLAVERAWRPAAAIALPDRRCVLLLPATASCHRTTAGRSASSSPTSASRTNGARASTSVARLRRAQRRVGRATPAAR